MWRTDQVTPAPTTWAQMFDPANGYKVSIYDAPIYIADAAVVLMKTKPELGIKNPYALDDAQFTAAIDLLKQQKPAVTQRWVDYLKQMDDFRSGTSNVGTTWQVIANLLKAEKPPVAVDLIKPTEGATGWSDTWMINSKSKNLACSYAFIDYLVSPKTNAEIADYFGEAPGNSKSCALTVEQEPLQGLPRRRRRVLAGRLVLADPGGHLRGRPDGRQVQGLRRVDQGLDRGQGLTRAAGDVTQRRPAATAGSPSVGRRVAAWSHRHPRLRLG